MAYDYSGKRKPGKKTKAIDIRSRHKGETVDLSIFFGYIAAKSIQAMENKNNWDKGYDVITPEIRKWHNNLFEFLFENIETNIWFMIRHASSFGKYIINDDDLRDMLGDFLFEYRSRHPETTYEDIERRLGPLYCGVRFVIESPDEESHE